MPPQKTGPWGQHDGEAAQHRGPSRPPVYTGLLAHMKAIVCDVCVKSQLISNLLSPTQSPNNVQRQMKMGFSP